MKFKTNNRFSEKTIRETLKVCREAQGDKEYFSTKEYRTACENVDQIVKRSSRTWYGRLRYLAELSIVVPVQYGIYKLKKEKENE